MPQAPQPIDQRVVTALGSLDHALFPFQSFDRDGNVIVPSPDETTPDAVKKLLAQLGPAVSQVTEEPDANGQPAWQRIFKVLSFLDDPGWDLYTLGVHYGRDGLNLLPVKALDSVPDEKQAARFADAMQGLWLKSVQEHLPDRPRFDPELVALLKRIATELQDALAKDGGTGGGGTGGETGGGGQSGETGDPVPPNAGDPVTPLAPSTNRPPANMRASQTPQAAAAAASIVVALRFVAAFAEYAVNLKERGWATATTVWYVTDLIQAEDEDLKRTYRALKKDDPSHGRRSVSVIWNPRNKSLVTWAREFSWQHGRPEVDMTPNRLDFAFNPPGAREG